MKSLFSFFLLILLTGSIYSQEINLNKYKYVIVNSKFDFVRQVDGYQTSSLTKFLFNKKGFVTFMDNEELNDELAINRCMALYADVKDDSGMFTTKLFIELKDCKGKLLYTSPMGSSRLKQYIKAYRESIKSAFTSIEKMPYTFDPTQADRVDVAKIKEPKIQKVDKVITQSEENPKKEIKTEKAIKDTKEMKSDSLEVLYAQPNQQGYQLVNTKPEVVFILLKTGNPEKFIIKDKNGTLVKDGSFWVAEYYENGNLVTKKYNVKF